MRTLWAFEPFHQDAVQTKEMHKLLTCLTGSKGNIEVGFVVTHQELKLSEAVATPAQERYTVYPREQAMAALKKAGVNLPDKHLHIVDHETTSVTEAVDQFLKLAKLCKADLIALFTQGHKGYMRYVLGSFAETAMHRSKTNLLILHPKAKPASRVKKVVFASDFEPTLKKHLATVLAHCKRLGASLSVLHHAKVTYAWSLDESNPKIHAYRKQVNQTKSWIENQCKAHGVAGAVIISAEFEATSDFILGNAKKHKADLIVISAKVGPLTALIGGSVSRKIVRGSEAAVLVLK